MKHAAILNGVAILSALGGTAFADVTISKDTTLMGDVDYSGQTVTVSTNATLNLAGNRLTAASISGEGTIASARLDEYVFATSGCVLLDYVITPDDNLTQAGSIDTGYKPNATDRIETKFSPGSSFNTTATIQWVFSARTTTNKNGFDCELGSGRIYFPYKNVSESYISASVSNVYEVVMDGNRGKVTITHDNTVTVKDLGGTGDFAPNQLKLFSTGENKTNRNAQSLKMYYFRVFSADGTLQINMLPATKDGVVGFYDTVRRIFFTLKRDNDVIPMTAGNDISYEALDSVKTPSTFPNTGIDTGYKPSWSDRVETKVKLGANPGGDKWIASTSANTDNRIDIFKGTKIQLQIGNTSNQHILGDYKEGDVYDIDIDGNNGIAKISRNGVQANITWTATAYNPSQNYVLFNQTTTKSRQFTDCTMYYFRVTDTNGCRKLDLIPAKKSDGTVGFYDKVRNAFLIPAGDSSLEGGAPLPHDLTEPGGTCWCSPAAQAETTAGNLFNNDFEYATDIGTTKRLYFGNPAAGTLLRIDYDFGSGNAQVVNMYRICGGGTNRTPKKWDFYGSNVDAAYAAPDESDWTLLDSVEGESPWAETELRMKTFANNTPYRYYRIRLAAPGGYCDLSQLEYFHVGQSAVPGKLHLVSDAATENPTVRLGGDLKLVKEGSGAFTASKADQFYVGGTEVAAGTLVANAANALGFGGVRVADGAVLQIASPLTLSGELGMAAGSELDFFFAARDSAPGLTLSGGASLPATLNLGILRSGEFSLPGDGLALTSGYDFRGTVIGFEKTAYARRIEPDANGNLRAYGPSGTVIIFY